MYSCQLSLASHDHLSAKKRDISHVLQTVEDDSATLAAL